MNRDQTDSKAQLVQALVNRFLSWRLPRDFTPDGGVTFDSYRPQASWPVGTNLLSAQQAEAMFKDLLDGVELPEKVIMMTKLSRQMRNAIGIARRYGGTLTRYEVCFWSGPACNPFAPYAGTKTVQALVDRGLLTLYRKGEPARDIRHADEAKLSVAGWSVANGT